MLEYETPYRIIFRAFLAIFDTASFSCSVKCIIPNPYPLVYTVRRVKPTVRRVKPTVRRVVCCMLIQCMHIQ
jgi:hypothetical protein